MGETSSPDIMFLSSMALHTLWVHIGGTELLALEFGLAVKVTKYLASRCVFIWLSICIYVATVAALGISGLHIVDYLLQILKEF